MDINEITFYDNKGVQHLRNDYKELKYALTDFHKQCIEKMRQKGVTEPDSPEGQKIIRRLALLKWGKNITDDKVQGCADLIRDEVQSHYVR